MKYKNLNEKPNRYKRIDVHYCYNDWLRKECVQLMRTHHNVGLDHGEQSESEQRSDPGKDVWLTAE